MTNPQVSTETIAAIATPNGIGGIGIIRISGVDVEAMAKLLAPATLPPPRYATPRAFVDATGNVVDYGLALYFPAPHSFTGDSVLELHAHGGVAILQALLAHCFALGARQADAGEFSLRAYQNGKINLTQAEAIADLVAAHSQAGVRAAARSLAGAFSQAVNQLVTRIAQVRVALESAIDFSDDDAQTEAAETAATQCTELADSLAPLLQQAKQGVLASGGVAVVIIGAPNVGKSSLLNRLLNAEAAIVADLPGTTRDLVERETVLDGIAFKFTDTAGLHESDDAIEREGMRRTRNRLQSADIVLSLAAPDAPAIEATHTAAQVLSVFNKTDLLGEGEQPPAGNIGVSAKTGAGVPTLQQALCHAVGWSDDETLFSARTRHIDALHKAHAHLQQAKASAAEPEIAAAWLQASEQSLVSIIGTRTDDDLLAEIFSQFCIGK